MGPVSAAAPTLPRGRDSRFGSTKVPFPRFMRRPKVVSSLEQTARQLQGVGCELGHEEKSGGDEASQRYNRDGERGI